MIAHINPRIDPSLTRRAIEAKLISEGFTHDTDDRRRLIAILSRIRSPSA